LNVCSVSPNPDLNAYSLTVTLDSQIQCSPALRKSYLSYTSPRKSACVLLLFGTLNVMKEKKAEV